MRSLSPPPIVHLCSYFTLIPILILSSTDYFLIRFIRNVIRFYYETFLLCNAYTQLVWGKKDSKSEPFPRVFFLPAANPFLTFDDPLLLVLTHRTQRWRSDTHHRMVKTRYRYINRGGGLVGWSLAKIHHHTSSHIITHHQTSSHIIQEWVGRPDQPDRRHNRQISH